MASAVSALNAQTIIISALLTVLLYQRNEHGYRQGRHDHADFPYFLTAAPMSLWVSSLAKRRLNGANAVRGCYGLHSVPVCPSFDVYRSKLDRSDQAHLRFRHHNLSNSIVGTATWLSYNTLLSLLTVTSWSAA